MSLTIAVISAGAMGSAVGARLAEGGAQVLTSLEGRSAATIERARAAGMQPASDADLVRTDLFLSIVPPDRAVPLAQWFADRLRGANAAPLYVDLNAINTATARQVADIVATAGAHPVDGSIVGMPPKPGPQTTSLYLASPDAPTLARAAAALGDHGLRIKTLAGEIGAASALKMTYAGITKGLVALGAAMILAAEREGAAEALAAELADSQPQLLARFQRGIPDMLPKAYRFVPEMEQIADFLGPQDPASAIYRALATFYAQIADDHAQSAPRATTLKTFPNG